VGAQIGGHPVDNRVHQVGDHSNPVGNPPLGAAHYLGVEDHHWWVAARNPDVGANLVSVLGDTKMEGSLHRCRGRVQHRVYCGVVVGSHRSLNWEDNQPHLLEACLERLKKTINKKWCGIHIWTQLKPNKPRESGEVGDENTIGRHELNRYSEVSNNRDALITV
jgi:hypothetical protein